MTYAEIQAEWIVACEEALISHRTTQQPTHRGHMNHDAMAKRVTPTPRARTPIHMRVPQHPVIGRGQFETAPDEIKAIVPLYDRPRRRRTT